VGEGGQDGRHQAGILSAAGITRQRLHMSTPSSTQTLLAMATGFWISRALYVAAKLGVADLLEESARTPEHLARLLHVHADALRRVLRVLASVGVFVEDLEGQFANTPNSELLKVGAPGSLHGFIVMLGEKESWRAWEEILHSVRTGEPAFKQAFGCSIFEYLDQNPEAARVFDEGMLSRGAQDDNVIRQTFDFSGAGEIVDVGGGRGSLLAAVLKAQPAAHGTLFELSHVAKLAEDSFDPGLRSRCRFASGDFFTDRLPSGADFYILKKVIHDWPNEQARRILKTCEAAMSDRSRLLVIEPIVPPGNEPSLAKLFDLFMLVWPGGRERTEPEHRDLLASADLTLSRIIRTGSAISILEARKGA
jgi:hypothetical protein